MRGAGTDTVTVTVPGVEAGTYVDDSHTGAYRYAGLLLLGHDGEAPTVAVDRWTVEVARSALNG